MKVYISSTYRDLHKHRDAVATVLRRMGHQPIGMEDYVAEGARPLNRCLEDVRNCDAYVGVFAWRYGFVPTGPIQPMPTLAGTSVGSTSITEFEFRQAVESNKDVLMFLLDPDAEWPVSQIDPRPADGNPISRLRDECSQKYLVSHFRTPEELASLVSAAIYRVEIERQMRTSLRIESGLNQPYISAGQIGDSGLMVIRDVIATAQDAKALQINLGDGTAWWMTRLFLLSSLAVDLTDIEVIVFTDTDNTFLGTASSRTVGFGLGRAFPYLLEFDDQIVRSARCDNLSGEVDRRTSAWSALMAGRGGEEKDPTFVTRRKLREWLGEELLTSAVDILPSDHPALQIQRIMDWPRPFVPIVEKGILKRVVDQQALTRHIAQMFIRELVARALSMTR